MVVLKVNKCIYCAYSKLNMPEYNKFKSTWEAGKIECGIDNNSPNKYKCTLWKIDKTEEQIKNISKALL